LIIWKQCFKICGEWLLRVLDWANHTIKPLIIRLQGAIWRPTQRVNYKASLDPTAYAFILHLHFQEWFRQMPVQIHEP
jgi:hypothetical protein